MIADFRLMIDGGEAEYGTGRHHLNDLLRQLALAEPQMDAGPTPEELKAELERMLNSSADSRVYLVASGNAVGKAGDLAHRLKIITF